MRKVWSTQTHHWRLELVDVARIRPVLHSVVCRKSPLPLASDSPWSAQRLQQSPSGTGTTAPPTIVSVQETHHTVPTRCRVLVGTSAHPPAAFSRRRATDAPAGRPLPVLCDLVVRTLRAFGASSHYLRLHPAFDREGGGGACCCVPPSQRTSSPSSPQTRRSSVVGPCTVVAALLTF